MRKALYVSLFLLVILSISFVFSSNANASHSWGGYHWGRTANPFALKLGDNVSSGWDSYLATTSADWSASSVLNTMVVTGSTTPKTCKSKLGRVEVCNSKYGNNGWLGIAQIWVNGTHITKGIVKLNDTYYNTPTYNTPAWKNLVMCQEVGHTFGLDHQDENFNNPNLDTCMDYTNNPASNQHPNAHDYEELENIYAHLDSVNTAFMSIALKAQNLLKGNEKDEVDLDDSKNWGEVVKKDKNGQSSLYVKDLGHGIQVYTHVFHILEE